MRSVGGGRRGRGVRGGGEMRGLGVSVWERVCKEGEWEGNKSKGRFVRK